jgi:hypothetical protein
MKVDTSLIDAFVQAVMLFLGGGWFLFLLGGLVLILFVKKRLGRVVGIILLGVGLFWFGYLVVRDRAYERKFLRVQANFELVKTGMIQDEVEKLLGHPSYHGPGPFLSEAPDYEEWFYCRERSFGYPKNTFPFWGIQKPKPFTFRAQDDGNYVVRFDLDDNVIRTKKPKRPHLR